MWPMISWARPLVPRQERGSTENHRPTTAAVTFSEDWMIFADGWMRRSGRYLATSRPASASTTSRTSTSTRSTRTGRSIAGGSEPIGTVRPRQAFQACRRASATDRQPRHGNRVHLPGDVSDAPLLSGRVGEPWSMPPAAQGREPLHPVRVHGRLDRHVALLAVGKDLGSGYSRSGIRPDRTYGGFLAVGMPRFGGKMP